TLPVRLKLFTIIRILALLTNRNRAETTVILSSMVSILRDEPEKQRRKCEFNGNGSRLLDHSNIRVESTGEI
ncbi:hypothetical protein L9F63_017129, partial [Diploptera punctata]